MQTLKLKWQDLIGTTTGRVMLALLLFKIVLCSGFLIYSYHTQIDSFKSIEMSKLTGVSKTLASSISAQKHTDLFDEYGQKDAIRNNGQSIYYSQLHERLKAAKIKNSLSSDIYTLVYNDRENEFEFGVTSSDQPYFRHRWTHFSKAHIEKYNQGTTLGPYKDENGIWLSSFSPIKNNRGKTVGIVQADEPFDKFIAKAENTAFERIVVILTVLAAMIYLMLHVVQAILSKEDRVKAVMKQQRNEIEIKNKEITSSINRAKMIQDALLPQLEKMKRVFPEMFVMFQPRDIVSGDFFWFAEKGKAIYFAVADCTGHGVPGGFMSMIGHSILNDAINYIDVDNPAEILNHLDAEMSKVLNENGRKTADGMDVALIKYSRDTGEMEFAGALRPLVKVSGGTIVIIKGDRQSIGGSNKLNKTFTNHKLKVNAGDSLYLFSDGYSDQFGGDKSRKYMSKRFNNFLGFVNEHVMEDQQYLLQYEFHHWKDNEDQVDDVLVAGLKIPEAA